MAANHRDLRASNHDDNHLPTDEICTIMCSEPSNVLSLKNSNAKTSQTSLMIKVGVSLSLILFFLRV